MTRRTEALNPPGPENGINIAAGKRKRYPQFSCRISSHKKRIPPIPNIMKVNTFKVPQYEAAVATSTVNKPIPYCAVCRLIEICLLNERNFRLRV
jgi:hypothetical protein